MIIVKGLFYSIPCIGMPSTILLDPLPRIFLCQSFGIVPHHTAVEKMEI